MEPFLFQLKIEKSQDITNKRLNRAALNLVTVALKTKRKKYNHDTITKI